MIAALLPLIGRRLPAGVVPAAAVYEQLRAGLLRVYLFYPDDGDTCNRYGNGVIYQVDCYSGMVEDVIPLYAGGYGVGQIIPSSYNYYNVPSQYRDMYYDTPDYGYWYSPGAIYQYDRGQQHDNFGRGADVAGLLGRSGASPRL